MVWTLTDDEATLDEAEVSASISTSNPEDGLQVRADSGVLSLFGFQSSGPLVESYVRNPDLVCRYAARDSDGVQHTSYMRALQDGCGLELLLSVQTSQLHSCPESWVRFAMEPGGLVTPDGNDPNNTCKSPTFHEFLLVRPKNRPGTTWGFFSPPGDVHEVHWNLDDRLRLSFSVFPHSLEKGVIRRVRFLFYALERGNDLAEASRISRALLAETPPLTT